MKIALVRARYNLAGGAERFAERALSALAGTNTAVSIIARSWNRDARAHEGWTIVPCNPFYVGSVWRDWSFAHAVRRLVARLGFDLVQSHERIPGLAIYRAGDGVHAAWLERRRAASGLGKRVGIWLSLHHRYLVWTERRMFEHPDLRAVICNSTLVVNEIRTRFRIDPQKLHLIPNGIDLDRFAPEPSREERRRVRLALQIAEAQPLLVFVGSGFERKGLALALWALARMPGEVHLVIVGHDKHGARYAGLARALGVDRRAHFLGAIDDPVPYYGAADALVLPTLYDPFPNAVLEALACGLPVITSDACGAIDVISEADNGWIHQSGNREDLLAKLGLWLSDHALAAKREAHARAARASVAAYSTERLATSLLALYEGLMGVAGGSMPV
ncbi:MAG: glycosyltransferase family 4 protein [Burkholderiaceae bacterium]|jgi:UDP-glucose:(heptosyl)LPS alpha-1,3-glucosyltransferase